MRRKIFGVLVLGLLLPSILTLAYEDPSYEEQLKDALSKANMALSVKELLVSGDALMAKKEYSAAISKINEAIKLDSNNAIAYWLRGVTYYTQGKIDEAILDQSTAIEKDPSFVLAYLMRASLFMKKHDLNRVVEDATRAIQIQPTYAAYKIRAVAHRNLHNEDATISDYMKVLEYDPNDAEAYSFRGVFYFRNQSYDNAVRDFTKAIQLNYTDLVTMYTYRGLSYAKMNEIDKAIENLSEALKLNPNNTELAAIRADLYKRKTT